MACAGSEVAHFVAVWRITLLFEVHVQFVSYSEHSAHQRFGARSSASKSAHYTPANTVMWWYRTWKHTSTVFSFFLETHFHCVRVDIQKWTEDVFETLQHVSQNDATLSYDDIIRISWQDISIRRPLQALYRAWKWLRQKLPGSTVVPL